MKNILSLFIILLFPIISYAEYVVDIELPTTNSTVTVSINNNNTGYKDFENYIDVIDGTKKGIGFYVSITNFIASSDGVSLKIYAKHNILTGWQKINAGSITIKTPIIKSSSANMKQYNIATNTWICIGKFQTITTGNNSIMIRVRRKKPNK